MCGVVWCYAGPLEKAEETFKPVRNFLKPALDLVGPIPHPAVQSMFDGLYPPGFQWYWKADFVNQLSDDAIEAHMQHAPNMPTMFSAVHVYPINGAAHRVGNNETAWSYRHATWAEVIVGVDPDPTKKDQLVTWACNYWEALHPYSAGGAYVNFMMDEGAEGVQATHRGNYERLAALKARYDPENLFHINQNIKPQPVGVRQQIASRRRARSPTRTVLTKVSRCGPRTGPIPANRSVKNSAGAAVPSLRRYWPGASRAPCGLIEPR